MKQIAFIAGQDGAVEKYDPKIHAPAVRSPKAQSLPMTRHQRATLYFKAIRCVGSLLKEVGFRSITLDSATSFVLELGDFILEMSAQIPPPMAHVTSFRGYAYDSEKINAKVTNMSPGAPGEYVIRVIATLPGFKTLPPIYVVVEKDSADPLKEAFQGAVAAARELIGKDKRTLDKIKTALAGRDLNKDYEKFSAEENKQLPD